VLPLSNGTQYSSQSQPPGLHSSTQVDPHTALTGLSLQKIIIDTKRTFFTGGDPFACEKCNERFAKWSHLHDHMRVHTVEQRFFTDISKTACVVPPVPIPFVGNDNGYNGVSHLRIHTVDRPFVCETCNRRFVYKSHLKKHERIHTGELPFICKICNTGFQRVTDLRRHEGLHSAERPFICDICHLNFRNVPKLLSHKRKNHSGERRYVCEICKKGYTNVKHLRDHFANIHSGE